MPETTPNIGPVSDKTVEDLFQLLLILEDLFAFRAKVDDDGSPTE